MINRRVKRSLVYQQDQADCGVACLLSVIRYYDGNSSISQLRSISGTDNQGTTLLGLYQAANSNGFDAKGVASDLKNIIELNRPSILHILKDNIEHYVVIYGKVKDQYIIGDPATGIEFYSENELEETWKSRHALILEPNKEFQKQKDNRKKKIKWIKKLIKEDNNILISSLILGIIISFLSMASAIFSQKLIDNILPSKDYSRLIIAIGFLFFIFSLGSLLSYLRSLFLIKQNRNFNNRITKFFYTSLLALPKSFFDTRAVGDMIARLNDTSRIQGFISQLAGNFIIDGLMLIVSLLFIFYYSPIFGIIAIIFFPIYFTVVRLNTAQIIEKQRNVMSNYAKVESNYINTIGGIFDIKSFNAQSHFDKLNSNIYNQYQTTIYNLGKHKSILSLVYGALGIVFSIILFGFGANKVISEDLRLGEFIAIFGISSSLIPYVTNLALIILPLNEAKIAFERMFEFTSLKQEEIKNSNNKFTFESLDVNSISFRYTGRKIILKDLSINLKVGEIISIIGESGCGKSTLAQIVNGMYLKESGEILINKTLPLETLNLSCWRESIAIVPQHIHIFNGTVLENISMKFGNNDYSNVLEFIKENELLRFFDEFPQGLFTLIGEMGVNLSGGQKQIVAIARALYRNPKLLILDEATSALDTKTEKEILSILKRVKSNTAILFITHRLHILKNLADKIYLLENGSVKTSGNHSQLMKTDNFYSQFYSNL